jgi:hypothetical protein
MAMARALLRGSELGSSTNKPKISSSIRKFQKVTRLVMMAVIRTLTGISENQLRRTMLINGALLNMSQNFQTQEKHSTWPTKFLRMLT